VIALDDSAPARETIASLLRDEILDGSLQPGERLIESTIAERFGVSRVPAREALSQLQSEGFVTLVRYRGATVSGAPKADALELMQVRRGLEVVAAELAAEVRGGPSAEALSSIVHRGHALHQTHDLVQVPPLVFEFHMIVAEASGNIELHRALSQVLTRVSWVFSHHIDVRADDSWNDHSMIARAILGGSPIQAGLLMGEHIRKDEELIRTLNLP
jgi:DNA-binding GntR family transcriptional regulator